MSADAPSVKLKSGTLEYQRAWHALNKERVAVQRRQYYIENKDKHNARAKERYLERTFGLSVEDYETQRAAAQHCSICSGEFDIQGPQLDHCHTTGKVRDWLCARCNRGIGHFDDSVEKLKQAIKYLEKHAGRD